MKKIIVILLIFNCFCIQKGKQYGNSMDLFTTMGASFAFLASISDNIQLTKRYLHTATLLNNGKVLITGGRNSENVLDSVKLYDPENGEISTVSNLLEPRYEHTATLLNNGTVLIAGGRNANNSLDSTEIYDVTTSTFTLGNTLTDNRSNHTATLLSNGKVLIAGGYSFTTASDGVVSSNFLSSAEFYDSNSTFSMNQTRSQHTVTLLTNNNLLIAGGKDDTGFISSAEIFDTGTNTFTLTSLSMNQGRGNHTATLLLNGKVLITGGIGFSADLSSAEIYDSSTDNFSYLSNQNSMETSRGLHTATLMYNGKVLIAGGSSTSSNSELYDPSSDSFSSINSLKISTQFHTATILSNGKVMIAAGIEGEDVTNAISIYDPATFRDLEDTRSRR